MIYFTDDMLTGFDEIDEQHRGLVNHVNELIDMRERAYFKDEVMSTLDFLAEYVVKHFHDEEALQEKIGYPKIEEHRVHHVEFIEKFGKFKNDLEEKGHSVMLALDINSTLIQWVINHIRTDDADIGRYYREQKG